MGTLFNQPERNYRKIDNKDIDAFLQNSLELAKKYKISIGDVINATKLLELERRNDLYVSNGDIFDEQMSGIGELLQKLISYLENKSNN